MSPSRHLPGHLLRDSALEQSIRSSSGSLPFITQAAYVTYLLWGQRHVSGNSSRKKSSCPCFCKSPGGTEIVRKTTDTLPGHGERGTDLIEITIQEIKIDTLYVLRLISKDQKQGIR